MEQFGDHRAQRSANGRVAAGYVNGDPGPACAGKTKMSAVVPICMLHGEILF